MAGLDRRICVPPELPCQTGVDITTTFVKALKRPLTVVFTGSRRPITLSKWKNGSRPYTWKRGTLKPTNLVNCEEGPSPTSCDRWKKGKSSRRQVAQQEEESEEEEEEEAPRRRSKAKSKVHTLGLPSSIS